MRCIPKMIDYDERYDVLYCNFSDTSNSDGDEIDSNLILLKDIDTDEVTGVTIYGFNQFFKNDSNKRRALSQYVELPAYI